MANGLNTACLNALHETMNWIAFHSIYVNSPSLRKQPKAQYYQIIVRNFIPEITDSRAVKEFALINLNAGYVQITTHADSESKYKIYYYWGNNRISSITALRKLDSPNLKTLYL